MYMNVAHMVRKKSIDLAKAISLAWHQRIPSRGTTSRCVNPLTDTSPPS